MRIKVTQPKFVALSVDVNAGLAWQLHLKSHMYSMCVPKNTDLGLRSYVQYERGCAVQWGRSSHFGTGEHYSKYFPMNKLLLFLMYQVKNS